MSTGPRGAFIVFEGIDRCGKSTQSLKLVEHLKRQNKPVELWRFPDRTCKVTGSTINAYLSKQLDMSDEAVHLLFSANRWEKRAQLEKKLAEGVTLVVDRYAFSGVAYSAAKANPNMSYKWCRACDAGLPAPDRVIYMEIAPESSARRGGFGGERYEKLAFQKQVVSMFERLMDASWKRIDAEQPINDIHLQVAAEADNILSAVEQGGYLLQHLWDGHPCISVCSVPLAPTSHVKAPQPELNTADETLPLRDQA